MQPSWHVQVVQILQPRPTMFSPCDSELVVTSSQVNVFKLGDVFQQLVKLLSMEQNPILARSAALAILPLCNRVYACCFLISIWRVMPVATICP